MADPITTYREIPLTQGKVTLVDAEDYGRVSVFRWCATRNKRGHWYAEHDTPNGAEKMHRFLMGLSPDDPRKVDHRNGDGLDNRRCNLRIATISQNAMNRGPQPNNTTGYKGVRYRKGNSPAKQWLAFIGWPPKHIGSFNAAEVAARAYDVKAVELYGEFAWLNFPPEGYVQNSATRELMT